MEANSIEGLRQKLEAYFERADARDAAGKALLEQLVQAINADLEQTKAVHHQWEQKLNRALDQLDERRNLGRELVEQRAENLELKRQNHRLELEVSSTRTQLDAASKPASQHEAPEIQQQADPRWASLSTEIRAVQDDLIDAQATLESLGRSRFIGTLSWLAPRPQAAVARAKQAIDRAVAALQRMKAER